MTRRKGGGETLPRPQARGIGSENACPVCHGRKVQFDTDTGEWTRIPCKACEGSGEAKWKEGPDKRRGRIAQTAIWIFSAATYAYGMMGCFDLDPLGLGIFPGIIAGAGAGGLMIAMAWHIAQRAEPRRDYRIKDHPQPTPEEAKRIKDEIRRILEGQGDA